MSTGPTKLRPFRPTPFARYTLLRPLSTGGMGEVYLARQVGAEGFEKYCVIKKMLPHLAAEAEFVGRFVNEAKTLVQLSHGAIAQVLDLGVHEGQPYIAIEYVDGKDLHKVALRAKEQAVALPLGFVLYVIGRVLDALAYAHRKRDPDGHDLRLVHRDISPQNVLVSYEGEVKVIDFGLAKTSLSIGKTRPSVVLGKFLYMSPEQARHQRVDRRSDLYAVGMCLYELISGSNPYDGVPPGELMLKVANPAVPPLAAVSPACPARVAAVVSRALATDATARYQTAEEFRAELAVCLAAVDPMAGAESASALMRQLFAHDFAVERRLFSQRPEDERRGGRGAAVPTDVLPVVELPADSPTLVADQGMLGPGLVAEPLSFEPTRRRSFTPLVTPPPEPPEDTQPRYRPGDLPADVTQEALMVEAPEVAKAGRTEANVVVHMPELAAPPLPSPLARVKAPAALRPRTPDRQPAVQLSAKERLRRSLRGFVGTWRALPAWRNLAAVLVLLLASFALGALSRVKFAAPGKQVLPRAHAPMQPHRSPATPGADLQSNGPSTPPDAPPLLVLPQGPADDVLVPLGADASPDTAHLWQTVQREFFQLTKDRPCHLSSMAEVCAKFAGLQGELSRGEAPDGLPARLQAFRNLMAAQP